LVFRHRLAAVDNSHDKRARAEGQNQVPSMMAFISNCHKEATKTEQTLFDETHYAEYRGALTCESLLVVRRFPSGMSTAMESVITETKFWFIWIVTQLGFS
jgi:hypothetical protein